MLDLQINFRPNRRFLAQIREAAEQAMILTLELDIIPDAVLGSPVKKGTNRRSISGDILTGASFKETKKVSVQTNARGELEGRVFTQSGYGGFLEEGWSRFVGLHYLRNAVEKNASKVKLYLREIIGGR